MPKPKIFTEAELQAMRDSVNSLRVKGAYTEGKWMTSPYSRDPRAIGTDAPREVVVRDITLRNIEQMPGVNLAPAVRHRLMEEIVAVGVAEIQLSMFGRGHTLESMSEDVRRVKAVNPACRMIMTGGRSEDDVKLARDAGIEIVQFGGAPAAGAAPIRIGGAFQAAWEGKDWRKSMVPVNKEQQNARVLLLIEACHAAGVEPSCTINQVNYADDEYIEEYASLVGKAGTKGILLADGPSGCAPEAFAYMTRLAKKHAPNAKIFVHPHNGFALANANSLAGVVAGAEGIEVTVNGYCSISGQADLAHVATSLEALYGIKTGIKLAELTRLARVAEEIIGQPISPMHPITGTSAFACGGSDSVIQELDIDPLIHWSLIPELVGNKRQWTITRATGNFSMWEKLDQLGIEADREHIEPVLEACLAKIRETGKPLSDELIGAIAVGVISQMAAITA